LKEIAIQQKLYVPFALNETLFIPKIFLKIYGMLGFPKPEASLQILQANGPAMNFWDESNFGSSVLNDV
jgi:hypothetical protein